MEHLLVGFFGGRNNVPWLFGPNTYDRHNLLVGPNVNARLMNDQAPVNRHEKPAWITRLLAASFCSPGDTVLVLGAGAGGDAVGLLAAGMNVIGLENDPAQFPFLSGRINTLANNFMTHKGSWDKTLPQAFVGRFGIPPKDIPVVKHVHAPKEEKIDPLPVGRSRRHLHQPQTNSCPRLDVRIAVGGSRTTTRPTSVVFAASPTTMGVLLHGQDVGLQTLCNIRLSRRNRRTQGLISIGPPVFHT